MPAISLNMLETYTLMAIGEEIVPRANFFRDRYFPTEAGDLFASDKVLTEYRKGDRKMASFVSPRVGDIPMDRRGYEIHEYQPARIAPSRPLTADELNKRGFGEALYSQSTQAQRAARLLQGDLRDMDLRIERREEWMCAKTMIDVRRILSYPVSIITDFPREEKVWRPFRKKAPGEKPGAFCIWNLFFGEDGQRSEKEDIVPLGGISFRQHSRTARNGAAGLADQLLQRIERLAGTDDVIDHQHPFTVQIFQIVLI